MQTRYDSTDRKGKDIVVKYYKYGTLPDLRSNVKDAVDMFLYAERNGHTRLQAAIATQFATLSSQLLEAENKMEFLTFQKKLLKHIDFNESRHTLLDSIPKHCPWQNCDVFKSIKLPCCGRRMCEMCWEDKNITASINKWECDCEQIFIGQTPLPASKPNPDKLVNIQCYNQYEHLWNCVAVVCLGDEKLLSTMVARRVAMLFNFDYDGWIRNPNPFRF